MKIFLVISKQSTLYTVFLSCSHYVNRSLSNLLWRFMKTRMQHESMSTLTYDRPHIHIKAYLVFSNFSHTDEWHYANANRRCWHVVLYTVDVLKVQKKVWIKKRVENGLDLGPFMLQKKKHNIWIWSQINASVEYGPPLKLFPLMQHCRSECGRGDSIINQYKIAHRYLLSGERGQKHEQLKVI